MKAIIGSCALGMALLQMQGAADAAGITYDCDTAADHFSELALPTPSGSFTVSGNVRLMTLAGSKNYVSLARIHVASATVPGEFPKDYAGFSLSALPADAKKTPSGAAAIQMLSYNANDKKEEVLPLSMIAKPGSVQSFILSYDGSNLAVNLGSETKSFPLRAIEPERFTITRTLKCRD